MENFGNIKDTFKNILIESIISKNDKDKKIFSKFVSKLKENKILGEQFLIYKNLQTKKFKKLSDAKEYVKENIELLKNLDKKQIKEGLTFFQTLLKDKVIIKENNTFYNHINFLIKTKKDPTNIDKINKSITFLSKPMIVTEMVEEKTETIDLPPSILTNLMVTKYNNKYSDITESEKEIIKTLLNGNDSEKSGIFVKLKKECLDLVNNKLVETKELDVNESMLLTKEKLLMVKEKLMEMVYVKEEHIKDITRIYELRESLNGGL
jgi:hypothetical protein